MQAVGRAGGAVVIEVRRQFKRYGIMKGKRKPDYGRLVDLLTKAAIKEMIIIIATCFIAGSFVLYNITNWRNGSSLILTWSDVTGRNYYRIICSSFNTAGGGVWDNAKKFIEDGNFGGKGSRHISQLLEILLATYKIQLVQL